MWKKFMIDDTDFVEKQRLENCEMPSIKKL